MNNIVLLKTDIQAVKATKTRARRKVHVATYNVWFNNTLMEIRVYTNIKKNVENS